jgi:hypothetical protein
MGEDLKGYRLQCVVPFFDHLREGLAAMRYQNQVQ